MRRFLKWFFDPGCSCEELRERVALAEKAEAFARQAFAREWSDRRAWEQTAESMGALADNLEAEHARVCADLARRYRSVSALYQHANQGWREALRQLAALERDAAKSAQRIAALEAQLNTGGPVS